MEEMIMTATGPAEAFIDATVRVARTLIAGGMDAQTASLVAARSLTRAALTDRPELLLKVAVDAGLVVIR